LRNEWSNLWWAKHLSLVFVCVCVCVCGIVVNVDWWEEWSWCEVFGLSSYGSSKMFIVSEILQLEIWGLNWSYIILMALVELMISFKGLWKIDLFMASRFQVLYTWNNLKNLNVIQGQGKWVSRSFESSFNVPWKPSIVIGFNFGCICARRQFLGGWPYICEYFSMFNVWDI
jgi:hypothetical protein